MPISLLYKTIPLSNNANFNIHIHKFDLNHFGLTRSIEATKQKNRSLIDSTNPNDIERLLLKVNPMFKIPDKEFAQGFLDQTKYRYFNHMN